MKEIDGPASSETPGQGGISARPVVTGWLQDIIPYGIFTTDHELRITSWNQWMVTHSGLIASGVLGRKLAEVYPDINKRHVQERYTRALAGEVGMLSVALHKYLLPFPSTVPESGLPHMLQTARIAPAPVAGGAAGTITIIEDVSQREFQAGILSWQQEIDRLLSNALATLLQAPDPLEEVAGIFSSIRGALRLDSYLCYLMGAADKKLQLHFAAGISPRQRESLAALPLSTADYQELQREASLTGVNLEAHAATFRPLGLRSLPAFPLVVGSHVIGLVVFGSYHRDSISSTDSNVLARVARYVAIALDRARRERETIAASRAKDDFLAALSHELRTPLNPVLLVASDAAANPEYPAEAREEFRLIEKNALLEARLIDDLLDLTRIAHGKLALEMGALEVAAVLRDALETVQPDVAEKGLTLHSELGGEPYWVAGDSGRLQQVFWNVIKNAVKFTHPGGRIAVTIATDPEKGDVTITVSDTGIGMEEAELARIFGAFSQGNHAIQGRSHRFGGLGLGLAISRTLVEMHNGQIGASSAGKGKGSSFTIRLPLARPADLTAVAPGPSPASTLRREGTSPISAPVQRILLVEDHEPTRKSLLLLLQRRNYDVVAVASAQDALEAATAQRFDLVLSDIGLPDESGFSLMRKLRDVHGLRGIALTGYGMEADMVRSNGAGFITHLTKPISVKVLDRALEKALQGPRAGTADHGLSRLGDSRLLPGSPEPVLRPDRLKPVAGLRASLNSASSAGEEPAWVKLMSKLGGFMPIQLKA